MMTKLHSLFLCFFLLTSIYAEAQMNFADKVLDVSREYDPYPEDWCAAQILGVPNVYPNYGDIEGAWASSDYGDQQDTIDLWFDNYGPIDSIAIYQTYSVGFVDKVWVKNPGTSDWDLVYTGAPAPDPSGTAEILGISFPMTSYDVSEVRITIAADLATEYVEIDAVGIWPESLANTAILRGNSMVFDGVDDAFHSLIPMNGTVNDSTKTIMAWVKVDGPAPIDDNVYNGSAICTDGDYAYFGILHTNIDGAGDSLFVYNYPDDSDYISVDYTEGEWMHIAMVHNKDTLIAYKNGAFVNGVSTGLTGSLGGFATIGYNSYSNAYFNGEIESVSLYNIALTEEAIREAMHRTPAFDEAGLTHHVDFNAPSMQYEVGYNPNTIGTPAQPSSVLPIGPGFAFSEVESAGTVDFTGTEFSANYTLQSEGEVTASYINDVPYAPESGDMVDQAFWVVSQFSGSAFNAAYTFHTESNLDPVSTDCYYVLFNRAFNAAGSWTRIDTATTVTSNSLTFDAMSDLEGQFMIIQEGTCLISDVTELKETNQLLVYPNPSAGSVFIKLPNSNASSIRIFNILGQELYSDNIALDLYEVNLPSGVYILKIENAGKIYSEQVIIHK